jgi:DNA replication protein DnaC
MPRSPAGSPPSTSPREARDHEARQLARINGSGIPAGLRGITFDLLTVDEANATAIEDAERWARGDILGLVLSGEVGVGKTWIAAAATNEKLKATPVRWFSAARFMVQARAGFKDRAREEITDVLTRPDLALVLDDIDKANPTEFTREVLFEAIDERIANATPILVTTNLRYPELEQRLGEPIASRLSTCQAHRIEGQDRRRKAA